MVILFYLHYDNIHCSDYNLNKTRKTLETYTSIHLIQ